MFISDEGLIAGSVNREQLSAAYAETSDEAVRANLAAVGAEHGMVVVDGKLVDLTADRPEGTIDEQLIEADAQGAVEAVEQLGRPAQAEPKAAWVDWAVSQGADRDEAEALTKAELIEFYGGTD